MSLSGGDLSMRHLFNQITRALSMGLILCGMSSLALAADSGVGTWPTQKPIRLIAVFPAGGSVDQVARILAPALQAELKQNVIVENVGGASGVIGTAAMTRAEPDGYTFAVVFDTHGVNPSLKDKLPYDTIKDIAPVSLIGTSPMVLVASKASGIKTFKQLVEESKAGKKFSYGSIGIGSLGHLAIARLAKTAGFDWIHVPYRGGGPLMQDVLGGQVPLGIGSQFLVMPHIENGGVVPLVITTAKRSPELPNVPTVAESGFPGFNAPAWWGLLAPGKTPPAIVNAMNAAVNKALKNPAVSEKFKAQGIQIVGGSPEVLGDFVGKQIAIWGKFVIENNIKDSQ
ncbi:tripartite tricarboxylate transporter substrate binding protein [Polynucleobacter paneuropaeus]